MGEVGVSVGVEDGSDLGLCIGVKGMGEVGVILLPTDLDSFLY